MNDTPSASQMYRHANCPGNRILIRSLKDRGLLKEEPSSLDASIGTRIHAALADEPQTLTMSEADVMQSCNRLARQCASVVFKQPLTEEPISEKRINYQIEGITVFTGRPDRVYGEGAGDYLDVNFKTGHKESPSSHLNLQLRAEVVLIYHYYKPKRVFAAIVEPLVSNKPEIVCYERADLITAEAEILKIVDRTDYVTARSAGLWCNHCPARAFCPEAHTLAIQEPLHVHTPELPSGDQAARLLDQLDAVESIVASIRKHYSGVVREKFGAVPGWHISAPREVRSIDPGMALMLLVDQNVTAEESAALLKQTILVGELEDLMKNVWELTGVEFDKKFAVVFKDAIKIHTTKGHLEKIPKRLLK